MAGSVCEGARERGEVSVEVGEVTVQGSKYYDRNECCLRHGLPQL